ncbi:hypothetical protein E1B28_008246 [Marasmius oreades]|uniref:RlpA-like protein double-psi beta-barrel domain-containing protein n=1 Tax=Marasmius oreades TaxID=181124 RepID=A0A9P7RZJ4_9AGAR|nr:uncharacterized protein E1B28_008246 [Marasmius oreades]KAG7091843.1 hypothetical protein E1B28_008246 [Marasmius oreades]
MVSTAALSLIMASLAVATQAFPAPKAVTIAEAQIASTTFNGDATFYAPSLGACGITNTANELVAAVAATIFDNFPGATGNPNTNPICGVRAVVTFQDKSVTVLIVDRCEGCGTTGINLSPTAFQFLAPLELARIPVQWTI